jgi:pyruvate dehydrogenase E1 component alpha subunit
MAARHRGDDHAILTLFGDGATSEGDFHEAMNFAGVFDAPVVFCCENNGWAISLPRERQTASETIAQKATAYGFEGVRVDGMDPIAVAETVADALATAHDTGPVLIESLTYRLGAHTTSDDPSRYRDDEGDLPEWRTTDPLERYETYLREQGLLDDGTANEIHADAEAAVEAAVERVEAMPEPEPGEVFDPIYERLPAELQRQRSAVVSAADTGEQ